MSREATTIIRRGRRFLPDLKKLERKRLNLDESFFAYVKYSISWTN